MRARGQGQRQGQEMTSSSLREMLPQNQRRPAETTAPITGTGTAPQIQAGQAQSKRSGVREMARGLAPSGAPPLKRSAVHEGQQPQSKGSMLPEGGQLSSQRGALQELGRNGSEHGQPPLKRGHVQEKSRGGVENGQGPAKKSALRQLAELGAQSDQPPLKSAAVTGEAPSVPHARPLQQERPAAKNEKPEAKSEQRDAKREQPETKREQPDAKKSRKQTAERPIGGVMAVALTQMRHNLEALCSADDVRAVVEQFPECVLVGGVSARRELVAALLGDYGHTHAAAAALVNPKRKEPLRLEVRASSQPTEIDTTPAGSKAETAWLRQLAVEVPCKKLSMLRCANVDVIELPENPSPDVCARYLDAASNILVCLEPGASLERCRRFDPKLERTLLLGAAQQEQAKKEGQMAALGGVYLTHSDLHGPMAARALEERFSSACYDRLPNWLQSLRGYERRLVAEHESSVASAKTEEVDDLVRKARNAGVWFGNGLDHVLQGALGCAAGAQTLEEDLQAFTEAAKRGELGTEGLLSGSAAMDAVADLWVSFGNKVETYVEYLKLCRVPLVDEPLSGGAAWTRLMAELEIALLLTHVPDEVLTTLQTDLVQLSGSGVQGPQLWDHVLGKMLVGIGLKPVMSRVTYACARVVWFLRQQKVAVAEWISSLEVGPSASSSLHNAAMFSETTTLLRSSNVSRDLIFRAFDAAAGNVADLFLKHLKTIAEISCVNADVVLRPDSFPNLETATYEAAKAARLKASRHRVKEEMRGRGGRSALLASNLRQRSLDGKLTSLDTTSAKSDYVRAELQRTINVIARKLAGQMRALTESMIAGFWRPQLEQAMAVADISHDYRMQASMRYAELQQVANGLHAQVTSVRRSIDALRSAAAAAAPQPRSSAEVPARSRKAEA